MFQNICQQGGRLAQGPRDEANTNTLAIGRIKLIFEPCWVTVSTSNQA